MRNQARNPRLTAAVRVLGLLGLGLLIAGFIVQDVQARSFTQGSRLPMMLWISGALLAGLALALDCRAILRWLGGRRITEGLNFVVVVILALALAGLLCYISTRRYVRMDWTGQQKYHLHSKTVNILRGLDADVEATVLYYLSEFSQENQQIIGWVTTTKDMLEEFKALSSHFTVQVLNATDAKSQERLQRLREKLGGESPPALSVIFTAADTHQTVPFERTVNASRSGGPSTFTGEDAFASALMKLTEDKKANVYALTGHGERLLEADAMPLSLGDGAHSVENDPRYSLSKLVKALRKDSYDVKPLSLQVAGKVPDDCAVLFIAGPRTPLSEPEIVAIQNYLAERNGCALVLADPELLSESDSNLEQLLEPYGIRLRTDAVGITQMMDILGRPLVQPAVPVLAGGLADHPVTADLKTYQLWFDQACPIEVDSPRPRPMLRAQPLLTGVDTSWGETEIKADETTVVEYNEGKDSSKPVVVGAIVEPFAPPGQMPVAPGEDIPGPKIVVIGSSLSFTDLMLSQNPANLYLLQNAVNWMAGKMHLMGIPPKTLDFNTASPSAAQIAVAHYVWVGILPGCIVVLGIGVWLLRRR